eukprot:8810526-Pyramimonas_sp.AAC.1
MPSGVVCGSLPGLRAPRVEARPSDFDRSGFGSPVRWGPKGRPAFKGGAGGTRDLCQQECGDRPTMGNM